MSGAQRCRLADGRWHFQHGPIDCILGADGDPAAIALAIERAWARFGAILAELVGELPLLRTDLASAAGAGVQPRGPVAQRMVAACRTHATNGRFITAMAAVAGSVAEELIAAFDDPRIERAYVNNGGDIALHLRPGAAFEVGWVVDPDAALKEVASRIADRWIAGAGRSGADGSASEPLPSGAAVAGPEADGRVALDGSFRITSASGVRGIATSGWRGRSFSLGIADSVTVLAATAAAADAAATVIANAVDADDRRIRRAPANTLRDDSDLGERLVTCAVGILAPEVVDRALAAGVAVAAAEIDAGRAVAAALSLQGRIRTCPGQRARAESVSFDTLDPVDALDPVRRQAVAPRLPASRPIGASPSLRM